MKTETLSIVTFASAAHYWAHGSLSLTGLCGRQWGLRRRCRAHRDAQNWRGKPVATARHRCDDVVCYHRGTCRTLTHAMRQPFISYDDVRPDDLDQRLFDHQAISVLHEIAQHFEAFRRS